MATGSRIRALRKSRGMTQRQLAEAVGCTDAAIRNYEADRRVLKGSALDEIASALGVAPEALMPVRAESTRDALELLFRIEEEFGLRPVGNGKLAIAPSAEKASKLAAAIKAWESQVDALDRGEITSEDTSPGRWGLAGTRALLHECVSGKHQTSMDVMAPDGFRLPFGQLPSLYPIRNE